MFGRLKSWRRWRVVEHQVVQTLRDHEVLPSMSEATHYEDDNLNHVSLVKQKSSIIKIRLITQTMRKNRTVRFISVSSFRIS